MADQPTVVEVAKYLRLDDASSPVEEADLVSRLIDMATVAVEDYCNRSFAQQTRTLELDKFSSVIELPYGPVGSITSISYVDVDGATQTLSSSSAWVLSKNRVTPAFGEVWPDTRDQLGAVTITYVAGDGNFPSPVVQSMYLLMADAYAQREGQIIGTISKINPVMMNLMTPYRISMGI